MTALEYAEARPDELAAAISSCPVLLLPVGTIEDHGHHLPLGLDGLKAEAIARAAAELLGAVIAPTSWWAADGVARAYTLRLPAEFLEPLLVEALVQLAGFGFEAIVIVNGHFGLENSRLVRRVALAAMTRSEATVLPVADYEVLLDLGDLGDHAGRWESSLLLGTRPDLVRLDAIPPGEIVHGVLGADPRGASEEEGRAGIGHAAERIADAARRALGADEVGRNAYRAALGAGLAALDVLAALRAELPRDRVPPVLTPAWAAHLRALDAGHFADALAAAQRKRRDPAA